MLRLVISLGLMTAATGWTAQAPSPDRSGPLVFATICSMCHVEETPRMRAPSVDALRRLTPDNIKDALTIGAMMDLGAGLSDKEIDNVAAFLTHPSAKDAEPPGGH
jgi:cytochrome c553